MNNEKYAQFLFEKELANKLNNTTVAERHTAYRTLYGEFFHRFPKVSYNPKSNIVHKLEWQMQLLKPFLDKNSTFLEIGAGNCLLSIEVAKCVNRVIAYEVADDIPHIENKPDNLMLKIFDGIDFLEPSESVDIIYSNQVFEHLHIEDTLSHVGQYYNMLKSNGKLIIVTPHALTGPHDISRDFSTTPEGLHMKEYTYKELKQILESAGFKSTNGFIGQKKIGYFQIKANFFIVLENFYRLLPMKIRYMLKTNQVLLNIFGIKIMVKK